MSRLCQVGCLPPGVVFQSVERAMKYCNWSVQASLVGANGANNKPRQHGSEAVVIQLSSDLSRQCQRATHNREFLQRAQSSSAQLVISWSPAALGLQRQLSQPGPLTCPAPGLMQSSSRRCRRGQAPAGIQPAPAGRQYASVQQSAHQAGTRVIRQGQERTKRRCSTHAWGQNSGRQHFCSISQPLPGMWSCSCPPACRWRPTGLRSRQLWPAPARARCRLRA